MPSPTISLMERISPLEAGAFVVKAGFLGSDPVLALGDGRIVFAGAQPRTVIAHPDAAILNAAFDKGRLVTGGDDGRVVATAADGTTTVLGDEKGRWIDALALGANGAVAWSAGRQVRARDAKGKIADWQAPASVRGLAFAPKGYRLACAHYHGASLWYPGTQAGPEFLEWKGSHLDVIWSHDARFVVTTMQENSLHGWRLSPKGHMRMTGYPGKTRSLDWSHDGDWLATSGADAVVVWPFGSEEGPTGKPPRECGVRHAKVSCVAFHPGALAIAAGYDDGAILFLRLTDASELMIRPAAKGGPITALAWDAKGLCLVFGTADGAAGLLTLPDRDG